MLVHAEGLNRGDAPVKLYHHAGSGSVILVGDAKTRILLTYEEALELYGLLEPFVRSQLGSSPTLKGAVQSKE
ncbi:MAG: hypothetical protein HYY45_10030 [Deltaproteobacteria bacterium]|nr:hypothetical protein [Deltaproteobacteria bacterium]